MDHGNRDQEEAELQSIREPDRQVRVRCKKGSVGSILRSSAKLAAVSAGEAAIVIEAQEEEGCKHWSG
jgi:hypothetical protein